MYEKSFSLEIIAPDRVLYRDGATSVSAPGVKGGFQILYNHAPLLSSLEVGQLKVKDKNGVDIFFATSGGVLEVRANKVVVLVETAERAKEIDIQRAEAARGRAQKRLSRRDENIDVQRAKLALLRALNRHRIAGKT